MSLSENEQFKILLKQIDWSAPPAVGEGLIKNLTVHANSKRWFFNFEWDDILPYDQFAEFDERLKHTFKPIANVDYQITTRANTITKEQVAGYWDWIIKHSGIQSSLLQVLCDKAVPDFQDQVLTVKVDNEISQNLLSEEALRTIGQKYQQAGFPQFKIQVAIDNDGAEQRLAQYHEEKIKRDKEIVQKATEAIKKAEKKKATEKKAAPQFNGKVQIGKPISDQEQVTQ